MKVGRWKFTVLSVISTLLIGSIGFAAAFPDTTGHSYDEAIQYVKNNGIVEGYSDGTFRPNQEINRAEFTKIIIESLYAEGEFATYANNSCFTDVRANEWYTKYVCFAKQGGIINGHPDGSFKPADTINYVEALKIILEAYENELGVDLNTFAEGNNWYDIYVDYADEKELSFAGKVSLDSDISRGQTAEVIYWLDGVFNDLSVTPGMNEEAIIDFETLEDLSSEEVLGDKRDQIGESTYSGEWSAVADLYVWKDAGMIEGGEYDGWRYAVLNLICEGPCFSASVYRFAWDPVQGDLVLLANHSSEYLPEYFADVFEIDNSAYLDNADPVDQIVLPEGKGVISLADRDQGFLTGEEYYDFTNKLGDVAFVDQEAGEVYFPDADLGCFYVVNKDGSVSRYDYDPGFGLTEESGNVEAEFVADGSTMNISQEFVYATSGCAVSGDCYLIKDEVDEADLVEVGETEDGVALFVVENPIKEATDQTGHSFVQYDLANLYRAYTAPFEFREDGAEPMSWEEFLEIEPVLFWQDPFGRWSSIINRQVIPPAECAKPVIYLYPEETIDVNVQVHIDEFTVTIPEYGKDGWNVKASPKSEIYNYADGETYPYLFWEGHEYDGIAIDSGFMIKKEEVPEFLSDSLKKLGLNEIEIKDFLEFWEPRMMENEEPYLFVSFLGTKDFNQVAPLTITPEPDTLIRVFMYYQPTYTPFSVMSQNLTSIEREGFTVIEWGGTSSKPWRK